MQTAIVYRPTQQFTDAWHKKWKKIQISPKNLYKAKILSTKCKQSVSPVSVHVMQLVASVCPRVVYVLFVL